MSLKDRVPPPAEAKWASNFAAAHFATVSAEEFFADEKFAPLMERIKSDSWSDLVKMYTKITGEDLRHATAAVLVAQSLR